MGVDAREARVRSSVERHFGRAVTYTSGVVTATLTGVYMPAARFMSPEFGGLDTGLPVLEVQASAFTDEGITPASGDTASFALDGVTRTYEVVRVGKPDHGWTVLSLGVPT